MECLDVACPILAQGDFPTASLPKLNCTCRMVSSGMSRRVALVRTDVSEKPTASFIRVTRIGGLGTTLAVTSSRRSVRMLLVTASVVPSSPILVTLMEALACVGC
jgi:hypothetical protein